MEKAPSESYARYFGLDIEMLRHWFELQFTTGLNWGNFGKTWQFSHIIPTTYFDYSKEADLVLCWNFINICIEKLDEDKSKGHRIDLLAVKPYFQDLYSKTNFSLCQKMLEKIDAIEASNIGSNPAIEGFIITNKNQLENMLGFSQEEFNSLNKGTTAEAVLLEREILRKFGTGT